jgi:hypothetical protein
LDVSDFIGNAVGAADDGTEGKYNGVEAGSCVVAELEVRKASEEAVFCL